MITKETLLKFLDHLQISSPHGNDQRKLLTHIIPNLEEVIELLFSILDDSNLVTDLERIKDDFFTHCNTIIEFRIVEYPIAIEGLAQKFEAFLKLIGFFRYKETEFWFGNETSLGIKDATLETLIEGTLPNKAHIPVGQRRVKLPYSILENNGLSAKIFFHLRKSLRNAVHNAPQYQKKDLVAYSEFVIIAYLFAIRDNFDLLAERYLPENLQRKRLITAHQKWDEKYIHTQLFETGISGLADISPTIVEAEWDQTRDSAEGVIQRKGKVLEIFDQVSQMVILGDPGLGKTTTLEYLAYHLSLKNNKTPVFFSLREYIKGTPLFQQIAFANKLNVSDAQKISEKENMVILLDGLNEVIIEQDRIVLKNELISLLRQPKSPALIITSRQSAYHNELKLPSFDLQPLSDQEILDYITHFDQTTGNTLSLSINQHPKIKELCRNPLLLKILLHISKSGKEVPANKGLILKRFLGDILSREVQKNPLFNKELYERYLIGLAFETRRQKKVSFTVDQGIQIISEMAQVIQPAADRYHIMGTLKDLGLIQKHNNFLSFSHELYQEYLAAEGIMLGLLSEQQMVEIVKDQHWEQPIILYSGLVSQAASFIQSVAEVSPLLASKCLDNSDLNDQQLINLIAEKAFNASQNIENLSSISDGMLTLLKLGKSDMISKSINTSLAKYGKTAHRFLGPVSSGLISNIDIDQLVPMIKLTIQISKDFARSIIRSLERRDKSEVAKYSTKIFNEFVKIGFSEIPLVSLFRLFKILDIVELPLSQLQEVKKYCLKLASHGNVISDYKVSELGRMLIHYNLIQDREFVIKTIEALGSKPGLNHGFIQFVASNNEEIIPYIIPYCLNAANISVQAAGIYFCRKANLTSLYQNSIEKSIVYQNKFYRSLVNKISPGKSYLHGIIKIGNHDEVRKYLERCKLNQMLTCRVLAHSKEGYYSLEVPDSLVKARIYNQEVCPEVKIELRKKYKLRISFIDHTTQTLQLSMLDSGNTNYEPNLRPLNNGTKLMAFVTKIQPNYILLSLENQLTAVLKLSHVDTHRKFNLEEKLTVFISGYDHHRKQYLVSLSQEFPFLQKSVKKKIAEKKEVNTDKVIKIRESVTKQDNSRSKTKHSNNKSN